MILRQNILHVMYQYLEDRTGFHMLYTCCHLRAFLRNCVHSQAAVVFLAGSSLAEFSTQGINYAPHHAGIPGGGIIPPHIL
jgi:hypothetical protein